MDTLYLGFTLTTYKESMKTEGQKGRKYVPRLSKLKSTAFLEVFYQYKRQKAHVHFERNSNGSRELDKEVTRAFLNQEKEFTGGNMSLVMYIYTTKQKKVDALWMRCGKCYTAISSSAGCYHFWAGSTRKRLGKIYKYMVLEKGKNRDKHTWLMPGAWYIRDLWKKSSLTAGGGVREDPRATQCILL